MGATFKQQLVSIGRGRVRFRINSFSGDEKYQEGRIASRNFVASTGDGSYGWWGQWHLTHLPTGKLVGVYGLRSFADAKRVAARMERLVDWSRIRKGSLRLADRVRVIADRYHDRRAVAARPAKAKRALATSASAAQE